MIKKIHFFNMIEILLALTVIAIGMTSILGLFPVGLNASRNAVAQNMSANVADQMVTYMRVTSEINKIQYMKAFYDDDSFSYATNIETQINGTSGETEFKYNSSGSTEEKEIDKNSELFLGAYSSKRIESNNLLDTTTIDFKRVAFRWAVFKVDGITNKPRTFFIVQGHNCTENDISGDPKVSRPVDYSAMALVWKSPVQIKRLDSSSNWTLWPENPSTGDSFYPALNPTLPASYEFSGKVNIEFSWPLSLPYAERKKRYYQVVITKP